MKTTSVNKDRFTRVKDILEFEAGGMSPERVIEFFQELINDGTAWSMHSIEGVNGFYGMAATRMIQYGLCKPPVARDVDLVFQAPCYSCRHRAAVPQSCHSACGNVHAHVRTKSGGERVFWPIMFDPSDVALCNGWERP